MNRSEWSEVCKGMVARWPHYDWAQATSLGALDKWFTDLEDLDGEAVEAAVQALYLDGREFPPNGGQIRNRALELDQDAPEWTTVWRWLGRLGRAGFTSPYYGPQFPQTVERCERVLDEAPGVVGEFVAACGHHELRRYLNDPDHGEARCRESFRVWLGRRERDARLVGLPSGLRSVARVNDREPKPLKAVLKALPGGKEHDGDEGGVA